MINEPMGQIWLWSSIADDLNEQDPAYFENFWTKPGYIGHDHPELVTNDIIDATLPVKRVLTAAELLSDEFASPEYMTMRTLVGIMAGSSGTLDQPYAVEIEGLGSGYRLGAGVKIMSGDVAGRQLYCNSYAGNVMFCDGHGEANLQRFTGVKAGDLVHVDNRRFLAFCYFARHHPMDDMQFDSMGARSIRSMTLR
jgi:prepilin-type processing-associated H-X9-DG protein